jgi:hypothetical protein
MGTNGLSCCSTGVVVVAMDLTCLSAHEKLTYWRAGPSYHHVQIGGRGSKRGCPLNAAVRVVPPWNVGIGFTLLDFNPPKECSR